MSRTPFEEQLVDRLVRLAAQAATEPSRDPVEAIRAGRDRRSMWVVAAATVLVVAGCALAWIAVRDDATSTIATQGRDPRTLPTADEPTPTSVADGEARAEIGPTWTTLPAGPVDGRIFAVEVWTGSELIVWGGETESETAWASDGAAFSLDTGRWRPIADSPLDARSEHVAVWTGTEMIVCCGRSPGGTARAAAAYDPAADSWRELAPPPFDAQFAVAVWTGTEMIVTGGIDFDGAAAYDPAADTWRTLADPPATIERNADVAWTGEVVVVWPRERTDAPGLVYDPATDAWDRLPELPVDLAVNRASMVWTGTEVIVWGSSLRGFDAVAIGARLDLDDPHWRPIADDPLPPSDPFEGTDGSSSAVWTGQEMIVWGGSIGGDIESSAARTLAYDPEADTWRDLGDVSTRPRYHPPMIWTGQVVLALTDPMVAIAPAFAPEPSTVPPGGVDRDSPAPVTIDSLPEPIDLTVLAVRPNYLSLAIIDLGTAATTVYPDGTHPLGIGASDGAAITPRGDALVWRGGTVFAFTGTALASDPVEISPSEVRMIHGAATELNVVPTPDGAAVWIVQQGLCCGMGHTDTLVELVEIDTGASVTTARLPAQVLPVGATEAGLVIDNLGKMVEVSPTGEVQPLGAGTAVAAWHRFVAFTDDDGRRLSILDATTGENRVVEIDRPGTWRAVGGPSIPSTAQPLPTVSSDGRLLIELGRDRDVNGSPATSTLFAVSLTDATATAIETFDDMVPVATWSRDDRWVALFDQRDLRLIDLSTGESTVVPDVVPDDHYVLGAG